MQHNIRSGLSCLHEQGISYIVLYGGYAAPHRLVRDCEVAWLCGFTYYEKRIYYVRTEQQKKA